MIEWGYIGWKGGFYVTRGGKSLAGAKYSASCQGFSYVGYRDISTGKVTLTHVRGKNNWIELPT